MENATEYEAPRISIQTKDIIRYNNHITYYKKNHSDFIQKSHYNSTNRQQNPSIYFVRQPEIFSLFKAEEIARRGSIRSCERPFPLLALLPSGHAVLLYVVGMCVCTGGAMDAAVLDMKHCADLFLFSTTFPVNHLLPPDHKETQPFHPGIQRSADASSNPRAATLNLPT